MTSLQGNPEENIFPLFGMTPLRTGETMAGKLVLVAESSGNPG